MRSVGKMSRRKVTGSHYTPLPMGRLVAGRILRYLKADHSGTIRVLDPACGQGVLLEAFELEAQRQGLESCEYVGVEADSGAVDSAAQQLTHLREHRLRLIHGDFLEMVGAARELTGLWRPDARMPDLGASFDVVIANPPYVRTQILGATESRRLADRFNLSGRVDLYQAFLVAATRVLRVGGIMGIILSNRFLTTVTGAAIRRFLADRYDIREVIDLGDTKLFEAAVLPAIFVGRRRDASTASAPSSSPARFLRVYSAAPSAQSSVDLSSGRQIYDILEQAKTGVYRLSEGTYRVSTGKLTVGRNAGRVWTLTTSDEAQWVARVKAKAVGCFGDVAKIRVGIKTTADSVFIRSDWEDLPPIARPESKLLLPLLSHSDATRWSRPAGELPSAKVLYPHEVRAGRRMAVDLGDLPRARRYLESHRDRLCGRRYLVESGRNWYEIWVPQDPGAWRETKIVFPDISAEPCFFLDASGAVVNGNCYWLTFKSGVSSDLLYLLLGLANSQLMTRFHDLAFNNKLYAGRRRYITQYVAFYPYPEPSSSAARKLIAVVKELVQSAERGMDKAIVSGLESQVDELATKCFGVTLD